MESFGDITTYAWRRLPLILLFCGGYLVYRLMAATKLTDAFVHWALRRCKGSAPLLLLYVIGTAAVLSSFIPNTIAVLTLLPVLKRLDRDFADRGASGMTTVLMCAAIYGAAIGGMGSMIGSPANAVLFAALDLFNVPGRERLNFFNWFLWSVPLVALFVLAAWGVAAGLGLPRSARGVRVVAAAPDGPSGADARQRYGGRLFWTYMGFWVLEAVAGQVAPGFGRVAPWVSLAFTVLYLYLLFIRPAPALPRASGPLLRVRDLVSGVPRRGLAFIILLGGLFAMVHWLRLDERAVALAEPLLRGDLSPHVLFLATILAVIFLTEVLSNTAVVAAFFTIAYAAAKAHGLPPLHLMLGVSLASTCAFMTPIATTTNALAFGEMRGASLRVMLLLGLVLNLAGAAILTGWLAWVLPLIY
ncbi:SLC13 family permease [Pseudodesulfovibrio sp.]|uniref:SLC13 family permease n=1 Tax=Pseudodesulfovibrio sp. TaxID=2035812 RepID=UPI00260C0748|nr:SLC13 family permease [Pseudodesulfovibrio sp.]MDD3311049.1 SLC13 family permease [Pseudodesulfovibrio sp.]